MEATAHAEQVRAGPFAGRTVAFTGRLASMGREEAERLVRSLAGLPAPGINSRTDFLVVGARGWPLREDGTVSTRLDLARRGRARGWRLRVISEAEFLHLAGRAPADEARGVRPFTLAQAAQASGASPADIRRWELAGLVAARDSLYDFRDIVSLRAIADLRARGIGLRTIQDSLHTLRDVMPAVERPLAQLKLLEADGRLLAQIGESLVLPTGQQVIDFEGLARAAPPARGAPVEAPTAPEFDPSSCWEDWLERGVELEARDQPIEAAEAYRRAIAVRPGSAAAHFNLANALQSLGRSEAAEELLRIAVAIDPGMEVAWYNLGALLEAAGRSEDAIGAFRRAVDAAPSFADARYNLAAALEDLGRGAEADPHWRAYLALDPASEWARVARGFLAGAPTG